MLRALSGRVEPGHDGAKETNLSSCPIQSRRSSPSALCTRERLNKKTEEDFEEDGKNLEEQLQSPGRGRWPDRGLIELL